MTSRSSRTTIARPARACVALVLLGGALGGLSCSPRGDSAPDPLSVLAAASLSSSLPLVAEEWERQTGQASAFSFDASSRLAVQVEAGAPADIIITADRQWMEWVEERVDLYGPPRVILRNRLVVIAGSDGPTRVMDLAQLVSREPGHLVLAGENVPAGRYAEAALRSAGVWDEVEPRILRSGSVRAVLEAVASGAAPMGIVYATDPVGRPEVRTLVSISSDLHPPIEYMGAVLARSNRPGIAEDFLEHLAPIGGVAELLAAGFIGPGGPQDGAAVPGALTPVASALPDPTRAVTLSLVVAVAATLLGLPFAVLLGWLLARKEFRGRTLLSALVLIPLVLPPVVTGFLLLSLLSPSAPLGAALAAMGLPIPFTLLGAVLAAFVVGMPLYVAAVRGAFAAVDPHLEEVSWTLGVRPKRTFWRVTVPLAAPGIAAGAILAFARALGEFGATVVLAGNMEGQTRTIALAVYTLLEAPEGRSAIWLLVGASVLLSVLALLGYELLSRRQREGGEWLR